MFPDQDYTNNLSLKFVKSAQHKLEAGRLTIGSQHVQLTKILNEYINFNCANDWSNFITSKDADIHKALLSAQSIPASQYHHSQVPDQLYLIQNQINAKLRELIGIGDVIMHLVSYNHIVHSDKAVACSVIRDKPEALPNLRFNDPFSPKYIHTSIMLVDPNYTENALKLYFFRLRHDVWNPSLNN
jgi:hypothetical protein